MSEVRRAVGVLRDQRVAAHVVEARERRVSMILGLDRMAQALLADASAASGELVSEEVRRFAEQDAAAIRRLLGSSRRS